MVFPQKYRRSREGAVDGLEEYVFRYTLNGVPESIFNGKTYSLYNNTVQHVYSEGHPYRELGKDASKDIGGPFESRKVQVRLGEGCRVWNAKSPFGTNRLATYLPLPSSRITNTLRWYNDGFAPYDDPISVKSLTGAPEWPQNASDNDLDTWGTRVISSVIPTNPVADVSVSIGELLSERKFFSLPGTSGSVPGEYLNYMFGVAPTIGLAQDLRKAIGEREALLENLHRNSGKLVRRQYRPEPVVSTAVTVYPNEALDYLGQETGLLSAYYATSGKLTVTTKTTTQWKFSGAFTYYIPEEGFGRKIADLDYLYGVRASASLAWELVPYSWLVDYKTSIGAAIKNLESFHQDGLVMPYAYVTRHTTVDTTYNWQGRMYDSSGSLVPFECEAYLHFVGVQRRPANPFGFGITSGDLSLRQLSIIAALGLSRVF